MGCTMKRWSWAVLLSFATAAPAMALDLKSAYQAAMIYDADLLAAKSANDEAQEGVPNARASLLPQLSYSLGKNSVTTLTHYLKGPNPDANSGRYDSQSSSLVLRQDAQDKCRT